MDFKNACDLLDLDNSLFTLAELKKAYYKAALKHHPDHNRDDSEKSHERFQKINEAYRFLTIYLDQDVHRDQDEDIISKFIKLLMNVNIKEISLASFEGLNKENALQIVEYIEMYSSMLGLDREFIDTLRVLAREKTKNDVEMIIHPTITNIINNDIYKLAYKEDIYYVPMWHEEVSYAISPTDYLIIKCQPELPKNMSIDHNNDLHIHILIPSIQELFKEPVLAVPIGEKVFEIPVGELKIKKNQIYTILNKGISLINVHDIYNTTRKGKIYVYLTINE